MRHGTTKSLEGNRAAKDPPSDATMERLADFFKIFGDATPMKILCALQSSELRVCDLTTFPGISQWAASHQLSLLRAAHGVKMRRDDRTVYCSPDDERVGVLVRMGLDHVLHVTFGDEAGER